MCVRVPLSKPVCASERAFDCVCLCVTGLGWITQVQSYHIGKDVGRREGGGGKGRGIGGRGGEGFKRGWRSRGTRKGCVFQDQTPIHQYGLRADLAQLSRGHGSIHR